MGQQNNHQNTLNRRSFIKFSGAAVFAGLSATMAYLYLGNEVNNPVVENVDISIRGLPNALEGFRIVQISDIHYYPFTKLELVDQAVQLANELQPDLVLLTCDYVWHEV